MSLPSKWLTVDPGESTGYTVWSGPERVHAGTAEMYDFMHAVGEPLLGERRCADRELVTRVSGWELMVMEDWALYPWLAQDLSWDRQLTVRLIGALEFIAKALGRPLVMQGADIKAAAKAAGAEDLFLRPLHDNRHANDATMHGVYYCATEEGVAARAA